MCERAKNRRQDRRRYRVDVNVTAAAGAPPGAPGSESRAEFDIAIEPFPT